MVAIIYVFHIVFLFTNSQFIRADRKPCQNCDNKRNMDHIDDILLRPDPLGYDDNDPNTKSVLKELETIYQNMIKPVEQQFRYADLRRHTMSEVDIYAKPIVLLVGPWSTGKSTLINYLLGIEGALESLYVGAEPTTGDFTVVSYGDEYRTVEGIVLATDPTQPFASMEKFGQIFLEHLLGVELNLPLLRNVTFIDTPGILENRRQQERGYPYNDVMRWLVHRSDLIFVVFDPTKLDVGWELESLFMQLKGKESVLRIILNKADSISEQDLIRVYGALFWSLSPLINVTEPPRVYVGSFWGEPYQDEEMSETLLREEKSLLHDMREVIRNRVYNKIAFLRQYGIRVRIHALLVDSYVAAFRRHKGIFGSGEGLGEQIVENPEEYDVFKTVLSHPNISKYDLPEPEEYEEFFRINPLSEQRRISEHCGYFSECAIDRLHQAISVDLPILLRRFQNPNERSRHHQRRPFDQVPQPDWKTMAGSKEAFVQTQSGGAGVAATSVPAHSGAKKYRKSAKVDQQLGDDGTSAGSKGNPEKTESIKPQQKRKRRSKESAEAEKSGGKIQNARTEEPVGESPSGKTHKPSRKVTPSKEKTKKVNTLPPASKAKKQPTATASPSKRGSREGSHEKSSRKVTPSKVKTPGRNREERRNGEETSGHKGTTRNVDDADQSTPKCNKYRKSCQSGENMERPDLQSGERMEKPVSVKAPVQPPKVEASKHSPKVESQSSEVKCNKYRKSCQSSESDQNGDDDHKKVESKTQSKKEPVQSKSSSPSKTSPTPSRTSTSSKTSTPSRTSTPSKASIPLQTDDGPKCNKYRKSCQQGTDASTATHAPPKPKETKTPPKAPVQTSNGDGVKCGTYSYRISCRDKGDDEGWRKEQNTKKSIPVVQEKPKTPINPSPAYVPPPGGPCNKYRKSCQGNQGTRSDGKDETGKINKEGKINEERKINKEGKINEERKINKEGKINEKKLTQSKTRSKEPAEHKMKVPQPSPNSNFPGNGPKCNKYRKSCQEGAQQSAATSTGRNPSSQRPGEEKKQASTNSPKSADSKVHNSPSGGHNAPSSPAVPCNKYRKSCQAQLLKEEEEEKPAAKKPCKKKEPSRTV